MEKMNVATLTQPTNKVSFMLSLTYRELRDIKNGIKILRKAGFDQELAADILLNSKLRQKCGESAVFDHNS